MKKVIDKIYEKLLKYFNDHGSYYLSTRRLPKLGDDFDIKLNFSRKEINSDVAIILQGPLRLEEDFTLNTIKFYKKIFPEAEIILSTWSDQDVKTLSAIKVLGIKVIETDPLKNRGCCNVNAQILSSKIGFDAINDEKIKFVAKTRTDQRIYNPNSFGYLKGILSCLDSMNGDCGRIIATDNFGNYDFSLPPFFMIDYFFFGKKSQMKRLLSIPMNDCEFKDRFDAQKKLGLSDMNFSEQCKYNIPPEFYICTSYLKSIGVLGDFGSNDFYNECLSKYFILISPSDIDLYWPKYDAKIFLPTPFLKKGNNKNFETRNMDLKYYLSEVQRSGKKD